MADNPNNDPFTRAFDAIQAACSTYAPLTALVLAGNRINLRVVNQVPRKESAEDAEFPEQFLKLTGFSFDSFETNSLHTAFNASYTMQISGGVITEEVVPRVWWETHRALRAYDRTGRLGLAPIVQRYSLHRTSPIRLTEYLGQEQWVAICGIMVYFKMGTADIDSYPAQTLTT